MSAWSDPGCIIGILLRAPRRRPLIWLIEMTTPTPPFFSRTPGRRAWPGIRRSNSCGFARGRFLGAVCFIARWLSCNCNCNWVSKTLLAF